MAGNVKKSTSFAASVQTEERTNAMCIEILNLNLDLFCVALESIKTIELPVSRALKQSAKGDRVASES